MLNFLRTTEGATERLYALVYKDHMKLCNAVVEFMYVLASLEGFEFVNNIVFKVDSNQERRPYSRFMDFLTKYRDATLNENALLFCNIMLRRCEAELGDEEKKSFSSRSTTWSSKRRFLSARQRPRRT